MTNAALSINGPLAQRLQRAAEQRGLGVEAILDQWLTIDETHPIESLPTYEEEIQRSHERYYSVIEAIAEGVVVQDAEGRIITCNASAERILGRSAAAMIGEVPSDPDQLAVQEDGSPFPEAMFPSCVSLRTGEPQKNVILGYHRADGSVCWLSVNSQPLRRSDMPTPYAVATSFADITERKRIEDDLRKSEAQFRTLVQSVSVGITLHTPTGAVLHCNQAALDIVGLTEAQMLGKAPTDPDVHVIREDGRPFPAEERPILRSIATRSPVRDVVCGIFRPSRKDYVWAQISAVPHLDTNGNITHIVSNMTDITELKSALQALTESERRFRRLADAAPVMIWMSDETMLCTYLNQRWIEFRGRTMEEELNDGWLEGLHPDDYNHFFELFRSAVEKRQPYEAEYRLLRHDGVYRWVVERGIPRFSSDGRFVGFVGTASDIGDMKAANHLLTSINEELEQRVKERTEALKAALAKEQEVHSLKTQFLSLVAHQFRTPLAVILTNTGILRMHGAKLDPEQQIERLRRIEAQVQRLSTLIQDVTTAHRFSQSKPTLTLRQTNVREMIRTITAELMSVFGESIQIELRADPQHETILTDPDMLYHALTNLLSNALKYSPATGNVSVTLTKQAQTTYISVADKGIGIPESDHPRLFGLFQRGSNVKDIQGTGLGLTIAKQCVEALEGQISFQSTVGVGTTFTVAIPNAEYHSEAVTVELSARARAEV
jgi:PAS domain S-box-containing protein